jgi:hypothetical protein
VYHLLPMQILSCHPTAKARRLLRLLFLRICEVSERSRFKLTHYPAHARLDFVGGTCPRKQRAYRGYQLPQSAFCDRRLRGRLGAI